jgi:GNAT superfamily N-acetyltransferase
MEAPIPLEARVITATLPISLLTYFSLRFVPIILPMSRCTGAIQFRIEVMTTRSDHQVEVRSATEHDVPVIYRMLRESAIAQGSEKALCANPDNLVEDGFRTVPPRFQCLIAEAGGRPAGIALYFFTYSTWTSRRFLYLEDLYVGSTFRRRGVGRSLMSELAKLAIDAGSSQIRWLMLRENNRALEFYESLGSQLKPAWCSMSIDGERLEALAKDPGGTIIHRLVKK